MCKICLTHPCDSRCPNAPEPPIYARCSMCEKPIYDGDDYYEIDDYNYCESCVRDCWKTAEVDL